MIGINPKNPGNGQERAESTGRKAQATGSTIGAVLRERREALGASLAEVEAAIKIRQKYLSALEADEWQMLPGEVVGRGFLRNYAAYLGLDATEIIERRRAIADPTLSTALAVTSAGSDLPPMRAVDYRPKAVDLRDEPDTLEERTPPRLGPLLAIVAGVAILVLVWWGLSRWGGSILDGVSSMADRTAGTVGGWFAAQPDAKATPSLAVVAPTTDALAVAPTSTSVFIAPGDSGASAAAPVEPAAVEPAAVDPAAAASVAAGGLLLPTATPQGAGAEPNAANPAAVAPTPAPIVEPPAATPVPPTPTPAVAQATVNTLANLRNAPSVDSELAGSAQVGQVINIVARSPDGLWFQMDSGGWIFGELVTGAPLDAPVAEVAAVEAPTPTPEVATETPVAEAPPPVVAAVCADARAQISSPGQNQVVSGLIPIQGRATHEAFASYKIEAGSPDGGLAFIGSGNIPVEGGQLGSLDTATFANGPLLIRVTVIDQSSNFPPPCDVIVTVQN